MVDDYQYDVFFSYKRQDFTLEWNRRVAHLLRRWLGEELGGTTLGQERVFFDERSIEVGQQWPDTLKTALHRSKCIACVWLPSYFRSDWCVSEWRTFCERETLTGKTLIAPLRFHDGEHFPPEAQRVQWIDVAPFASTLPAFWDSPASLKLEDQIKLYAGRLATMVRAAPPFDANWKVVEAKGAATPKIDLAAL